MSGCGCGCCLLSSASGGRVLGADYIYDACGEIVELVKAFEQPTTGNRAGREHRIRGVSRFREEDTVYPEASEVRGGG
jgi:IS5 family transposase